jgi:hypothetical protein
MILEARPAQNFRSGLESQDEASVFAPNHSTEKLIRSQFFSKV